jgi:metallo-beta-lactamase family protein
MPVNVTFTGATGTVTGSHHVIEMGQARFLLDCGLYQGGRELRERNWQPFPVPPRSLDAVILSHAHIDHSGYLPRLVRDGFAGPVLTSDATRDLCAVLLPDSGRLQEEEAEYRARRVGSRHQPPLPLYTEQDAERAVQSLRPLPFHEAHALPDGGSVTLRRAGHILGSALVQVQIDGITLLFSGDLGRQDPPLLLPPERVTEADFLILESTYGNRRHEERDPRPTLERLIAGVVQRRGVLVIPAFAVGRTQELLFVLRELEDADRIPTLPVFVDSPMATDATRIVEDHPEELAQDVRRFGDRALRPRELRFTATVEQSKALNERSGPAIIISASGMATGGRVLHHLRHRLPDARNTVLLAGFQAEGSRGRLLQDGAQTLSIFHEQIPVRAQIATIDALSAHADVDEIIAWLGGFARPPRRTFLVHGEDDARAALAERVRADLGWDVAVPSFNERVTLA